MPEKTRRTHSENLARLREKYRRMRDGTVCRCGRQKKAGSGKCSPCYKKAHLQSKIAKKCPKPQQSISIRECSYNSNHGIYPCFSVTYWRQGLRHVRFTFAYGYRKTRLEAFSEALGCAFTAFLDMFGRVPRIEEIPYGQSPSLQKAIQSIQRKRNLSLWYRPHTKAA